MKTVGEILKEARLKKKLSLKKVESKTRIKTEFIQAIEDSDWPHLPDFTVVSGFVRNLAGFFGLEAKTALAFLKRDYPVSKVVINPQPDVAGKFVWTPKTTFIVSILIVVAMVLGYLGIQYYQYNAPPPLSVTAPEEGLVVTSKKLTVTGKTESDAVIKVNNQAVLVGSTGNFTTELEIFAGTEEIEVKAISRSGKETVIKRKIKPEL